MTDRFALGNGTTPPCNPSDKKYCGGDWRGIMHQLDYIQSMGFDAIWISPVSATVNSTNDGEAYHGYVGQALHIRVPYLYVTLVIGLVTSTPSTRTSAMTQTSRALYRKYIHERCSSC